MQIFAGVRWRWGVKWEWGRWKWLFSLLSLLTILSDFLYKRPQLLYRNMQAAHFAMLHPTCGTNFLSSFVGLIFRMSHLLPRLMSFHLYQLHLFYYPLLHHSFVQNSKLTRFTNHFHLSLFLYLALIGFYLPVSFYFRWCSVSATCGRLSWLLVSFWADWAFVKHRRIIRIVWWQLHSRAVVRTDNGSHTMHLTYELRTHRT